MSLNVQVEKQNYLAMGEYINHQNVFWLLERV